MSKADFEAIPKIELDPTLDFGHPCATHPVAEVADPLHEGEKMSCLSCHTPHASTLPNLLVSVKGSGGVCDACHRAIDKQKEAKLESQLKSQRTSNLPTQFTLKGVGTAGTHLEVTDARNSLRPGRIFLRDSSSR
jgi:predicted CXXCH cytochrome family protein